MLIIRAQFCLVVLIRPSSDRIISGGPTVYGGVALWFPVGDINWVPCLFPIWAHSHFVRVNRVV